MVQVSTLDFLYRGQVSVKVSFSKVLANDLSTILSRFELYYLRGGEWWNLAKVWQSLRICLSSLWNFPLKFDSPPPRVSRINKLLVSDRYILSPPLYRATLHTTTPFTPLWIIKSCWMHHSEGITINSTRYHDFAATIKQDFIIYNPVFSA